jgi:hypothetical protein
VVPKKEASSAAIVFFLRASRADIIQDWFGFLISTFIWENRA